MTSTGLPRLDLAPITKLHGAADGAKVMGLERANIGELVKGGWKPPEVFVAKGRDGTTDIYGVIFRPADFDPSRTYPVLENIDAGPQSSFVPKSFSAFNPCRRRPSSASSSSRSTAWARATGRRHFTTLPGRTSRTPAFPIASSGIRPWPGSIRTTTSRASGCMATPPAVRTRSAGCSSFPSSTRRRCQSPAATTTAWTRSGGTNSGWAGRSGLNTRSRPTLDQMLKASSATTAASRP